MKRLTLLTTIMIGTALLGGMALGAKSLLQCLTSPDAEERDQAQREVLKQRDILTHTLVELLNREGDDVEQWRQERTQVKTAVHVLGESRDPSAVDALVKHLNTGRNIEEGFDSSAWPSSWGPNTVASALINIGKPSVPPVLDVLAETTDTEIARQCGLIIRSVEGKEVGRFILEKAIEREENPQKRANLERAVPFFRGG
jgi:hypothetical protein